MFDPIPIYLAVDRTRSGIEDPAPERAPSQARLLAASALHRLADRLEGRRIAHPRPVTQVRSLS